MKICPTCSRKYEDDTLQFCLDDGSRLAAGADPQATWHLPQQPPQQPIVEARRNPVPPTAQSPPATITARPEHFQALPRPAAPPQAYPEERSRSSALPWILGIVVVLGISGVLIAWLVTRGGSQQVAVIYPSPTPQVTPTPDIEEPSVIPTPRTTPTATDEKRPKPTPESTPERAKPAFTLMNNISYSGGSRITYYPRASVGQCQADCAANASCRAFTWIRPGAYNPGDSAMCYLMASVSGPVSHPCCISGTKN